MNDTSLMTQSEMLGLARRLSARANSVLLRDQPEQQSDLRTAACLVERLVEVLAEIRLIAGSTTDKASEQHLRDLVVGRRA